MYLKNGALVQFESSDFYFGSPRATKQRRDLIVTRECIRGKLLGWQLA